MSFDQPTVEGTVDPVALPEPPMSAADMEELSMDGDGDEVDEDGPQPGNELHPPASRARKTKSAAARGAPVAQPCATNAARRRRQDGPPARPEAIQGVAVGPFRGAGSSDPAVAGRSEGRPLLPEYLIST